MQKNDLRIQEALTQLEKEKSLIPPIIKTNYKTNLQFEVGGVMKNLRTISDPKKLMLLFGEATLKTDLLEGVKDKLSLFEIDVRDIEISGYSIQDWEHDFRALILETVRTQKLKEIETKISKLKNLISTDLKTSMQIDEILGK